MPMPTAIKIIVRSRSGTHNRLILTPTLAAMRKMMSAQDATRKSKKLAIAAEMGKISLGKYILVTSSLLLMRLKQENRMLETKKDHGSDFTATLVMSSILNG